MDIDLDNNSIDDNEPKYDSDEGSEYIDDSDDEINLHVKRKRNRNEAEDNIKPKIDIITTHKSNIKQSSEELDFISPSSNYPPTSLLAKLLHGDIIGFVSRIECICTVE